MKFPIALNRLIFGINATINSVITYKPDRGRDTWQCYQETLLLGTGDCEDFVFLKMHVLQTCLPPEARLYAAYVTTPEGVAHMVLLIEYEDSIAVLDNTTSAILNYDECPYEKAVYKIDVAGNLFNFAGESLNNTSQQYLEMLQKIV